MMELSLVNCFYQRMIFIFELLENGKKLRCCALRPNGIYGENEKRHLPRVADNIEAGYTIFKFGTGTISIDWVHAKNLVQVRN